MSYSVKLFIKSNSGNSSDLKYIKNKLKKILNELNLCGHKTYNKKNVNKYFTLYKSPFVYKKFKNTYLQREVSYVTFLYVSTFLEIQMLSEIVKNLSKNFDISLEIVN